jgi:hypothetical protein
MSKRTLPMDRSEWTPEEEKDFLEFYAGVLGREAQARAQRSPGFAADLQSWADKARAKAAAIDLTPAQGDVFGPSTNLMTGRKA